MLRYALEFYIFLFDSYLSIFLSGLLCYFSKNMIDLMRLAYCLLKLILLSLCSLNSKIKLKFLIAHHIAEPSQILPPPQHSNQIQINNIESPNDSS